MTDVDAVLPGQANTDTGGQGEAAGKEPGPKEPADGEAGGLLGGTAGEDKGGATPGEEGEGSPGAPETYQFTLPDGMEVDKELEAEFTPFARELNLTQEQAQKLADMYAKRVGQESARQIEAGEELAAADRATAEADPEYGGAKMDENLSHSTRFLKAVDPEDRFIKHLNERKFISLNDPELIRILIRAGKLMAEDQTPGGRAAFGQKSPAEILYPSMGK